MNDLIKKIMEESDFVHNPYFVDLRDGRFAKEDFIETQIQFYFCVVFFPRPLSALAAKIPTHQKRLEILRNVWEEHGDGQEKDFHGSTFLKFLDRLENISVEDIQKRKLWPEVRSFNTTLIGSCVLDEFIVGSALLGMIEKMFSEISSLIGNAVVKNEWLKKKSMIHYNLHKDLDVKHSQDFFDVLEESWNESDENKYLIEQGLRLGAYSFDQLYRGLHASRKKRLISDVPILRHQRT